MIDKVRDIKEDFEGEHKTVAVADAGYFEEKEIVKASSLDDFEVYVSHPRDPSGKKKAKKEKVPATGYEIDDFKYDKDNDQFICPEDKVLRKSGNGYIDKRSKTRKYKYICKDCDECIKKNLCTNNKKGRAVKITENFKEIMLFREKCSSEFGKRVIKKRKETVEHPYGTFKRNWGYRYFMQKGIGAVKAEFSFITFIYNLRRVLNLVSIDNLIKQLELIEA